MPFLSTQPGQVTKGETALTNHLEHVSNWENDGSGDQPAEASWVRPVHVELTHDYTIAVGHDILANGALDSTLEKLHEDYPRAWLFIDENVQVLHKERVALIDKAGDWIKDAFVLPSGERTKSESVWSTAVEWMGDRQVQRRDLIIAVGGSVSTDLAAFVAATYMRGIPYINVSTTVLGQVDGAIGAKSAVNTQHSKNLLGAFWEPKLVISDTAFLETLPRDEIANGLAEVIKTFAIESPEVFDRFVELAPLCLDKNPKALTDVVRLCTSIKMHLIDPDPHEIDLRRVMNFGHALGHPIETAFEYEKMRHGEGVAIGMACEARIGLSRGITTRETHDRIIDLIKATELPTTIEEDSVDRVLELVDMVRAVRGGSFRFVVPMELGKRMAIIDDVTKDEMAKALVADLP